MSTVILKVKPSTEPNLSKELRHYGIPGMMWGRRRFQDYDGQLTDLGKKRYAKQVQKARREAYDEAYKKAYNKEKDRLIAIEAAAGRTPDSAKIDAAANAVAVASAKASANMTSRNTKFDIGKEVQKDREATETILKETGNMANTASNAVKRARIDVPKMDLSTMSDQEMRNAINRARLDGEYDDMFNPERARVRAGRERIANFLDNFDTSVKMVGGALGIALLVKQLREG